MADSIKRQCLARIMANLAAMVSTVDPTPAGKVRKVTRESDLLACADALPNLMVYDGEEIPMPEKDDEKGRTFRFPLLVKISVKKGRDLIDIKDALVPEVQRIMESDPQLNGLANTVEGGAETPFIAEHMPEGGALLSFEVEYRRKIGNPYATY